MANLTDTELQNLKSELNDDPDALGYHDADNNLKANAELGRIINAVRSAYSVQRPSIPTSEFVGQILNHDEVTSLSDTNNVLHLFLIVQGDVDGSSSQIDTALNNIFGSNSTTVSNWDTERVRDASRAEDLFGTGTSITMENLADARSL